MISPTILPKKAPARNRPRKLGDLPLTLLTLALVASGVLAGCNWVTPGTHPSAPPTIGVRVYDYTFTTCTMTTCMGCCAGIQTAGRTDACPYSQCNPINLTGSVVSGQMQWFLSDLVRPNIDALISISATDPTGVQSLSITYNFVTCPNGPDYPSWNSLPLTSFNNGGFSAPSNTFTLNSTPGPQNNNQAVTELSFPITITQTDLTTIKCPNPPGGNSNGVGDLMIQIQASNFSTDGNKTAQGLFTLQVGRAPLPQQ